MLYERCGSFEHAQEAFEGVLKMDPMTNKKPEILYRLGAIYKQTQKYAQSLECFSLIVASPPPPRTAADVWLHIGHIYELQQQYEKAMEAYQNGMQENANNPKLLQHIAWLRLQDCPFQNVSTAVQLLNKASEIDPNDAQSWYILGRCHVGQSEYNKAHHAYQQAVYRDERNPTLWCSIGILYYRIGQYKEALDAYSKAIRFNPFMSAVWYNLGTLYESCKQPPDAKDAYQHALEIDKDSTHVRERLRRLQLGAENPSLLEGLHPLPPVLEPVAIRALDAADPAQGAGGASDAAAFESAIKTESATTEAAAAVSTPAGGAAPAGVPGLSLGLAGLLPPSGSTEISAEAAEVARKMTAQPLSLLGLVQRGGLGALSQDTVASLLGGACGVPALVGGVLSQAGAAGSSKDGPSGTEGGLLGLGARVRGRG